MSETPLVHVDWIEKRLSATFRLSAPTLTIARGETLAIVGPTGAGKSTLLKMLAGLIAPDQGRVSFDGADLAKPAESQAARHRIAWMPQNPLMQRGSVRYNVEYGLRIRGLSDQATRNAKVDAILALLDLTKLAAQSARTLSGGQIQLTALARALVVEPELLVLDEPTANLDPARVAMVETALRTTARERRPAIVWATHNLFQARRTAERVCLILDGVPIETAATETFFTQPRDSRTADFVAGKMIY
ncbi:MAG: ATP-binding cassette domain-containing protein [Planctomycetia bacterium]|nr:ATP-binding cassette domain-containing protein [Planctomycetia bacterium]